MNVLSFSFYLPYCVTFRSIYSAIVHTSLCSLLIAVQQSTSISLSFFPSSEHSLSLYILACAFPLIRFKFFLSLVIEFALIPTILQKHVPDILNFLNNYVATGTSGLYILACA